MTKILVSLKTLQLADNALVYQLLDRRSFLQLLSLTGCSTIPDAKTIWLFRGCLAQAGLSFKLFGPVQQQRPPNYLARCGEIIDTSLVQALVSEINARKLRPSRKHHADFLKASQTRAKRYLRQMDEETWQDPLRL